MQPNVSLSLLFFFFFFLNLLHIFSYGSAGKIHLFWSLMKCAVWVCGRMHICMCAVCECEDVNVACCCVIISSFLATQVQLLRWPAGVTVSQKDMERVTKDKRTSD